MSKQLTLTYISRTPRTSKDNKPYTSVSIKAAEYGDTYIGGFGNKSNESWKVGDVVEVESVDKKEYNGKTYLNFTLPKRTAVAPSANSQKVEELLTKISEQLGRILIAVSPKMTPPEPDLGYEYPESEGSPNFDQI